MPSTFSPSLNTELMATGENAGTWGTKTNTNLQLLDEAIAGYAQVSVSAFVTLDIAQASSSPGRNAFIEIVGGYAVSGTFNVRVPAVEKGYFIKVSVSTSGVLTMNIAVTGQDGATVTCVSAAGRVQTIPWRHFICDGTSVWQAGFVGGSSFVVDAGGAVTVVGVLSSVATQGTGLIAKTATGAVAARTLTGATNEISVNEGGGVSANPRIALASIVTFPGAWLPTIVTISVSASNVSLASYARSNTYLLAVVSAGLGGIVTVQPPNLGGAAQGLIIYSNGTAASFSYKWKTGDAPFDPVGFTSVAVGDKKYQRFLQYTFPGGYTQHVLETPVTAQ